MNIVNFSAKYMPQDWTRDGIYKQIEQAGRTCYKSEDKITEDSPKAFVYRMIKSGHLSMLEHGTVYLAIPITTYAPDAVNFYYNNPYSKVNKCDEFIFKDKYGDKVATWCVTTNFRFIVENNLLEDLEFLCEPTTYHAKRYSIKLTTNIGITREGNRHRQSIAEESTRYCNYSKDKFGNDITIVPPIWIAHTDHIHSKKENITNLGYIIDDIISETPISASDIEAYFATIEFCGIMYNHLLDCGWTPQQAREVLPLATKSDVVYTKFEDEWEHFFDLRLVGITGKPHPNIQHCAALIINEFYKNEIYISNYELYHYYASKLKI